MTVSPPTLPAVGPPRLALSESPRSGSDDFQRRLGRASADQAVPGRTPQDAKEAADELVSAAFILPILSQVRESPFKSDLLDGGRAEAAFGQQLDVILANNITESAQFGIGKALVQQLAGPGAATQGVDLRG